MSVRQTVFFLSMLVIYVFRTDHINVVDTWSSIRLNPPFFCQFSCCVNKYCPYITAVCVRRFSMFIMIWCVNFAFFQDMPVTPNITEQNNLTDLFNHLLYSKYKHPCQSFLVT